MYKRYDISSIETNDSEIYEYVFNKKNVKFIKQYKTPTFKQISSADLKGVEIYKHIWTYGDRYYKLAQIFYRDPTLWWIIALINKKPTESHISLGDIIYIPANAEQALSILTRD